MKAFNAAYSQYEGDETKAFAVAWAAVKHKFKKSKEGVWIAKDSLPEGNKDMADKESVCDPDSEDYDEDECERRSEYSDCKYVETAILDRASFKLTADGYLVANARVARTGIQEYLGSELGDKREIVKVYRPEKTVFDKASLATFAHKPVTLNHPPVFVDASNWRDYAVGHVDGEIMRDGDMVKIPMLLMDGAAVKAIKNGSAQFSVGYDARIEWKDGKTEAGEDYNAVQHDIRVNHIALVSAARGGDRLTLGDERNKVMDPKTKNVIIDGIDVALPEQSASIVERAISKLDRAVKDASTSSDDLRQENITLRDKVAELEANLRKATISDAELDRRAEARLRLITDSRKILGDSYSPDGKTSEDIKRAVVIARLGPEIVKEMTDQSIAGAYLALVSQQSNQQGNVRELSDALSRPGNMKQQTNDADNAWEERGKIMRDAWKNPPRVA